MLRNKLIKVRCFPGAKVEDMADYTRPLLKSQPTTIIVHAGTNNLNSEDAIMVRNKLLTLKDNIEQKHSNTAVILSTLRPKTDDRLLEQKVGDVNELLINSGVDIVNNDNVKYHNLNRSKLHLKYSRAALLAKNFIAKIRNI